MPFNANTYAMHRHTDLYDLLEEAVADEEGIFVPTDTVSEAKWLILELSKYRKAHEAQGENTHDCYKYTYITFKVRDPRRVNGGETGVGGVSGVVINSAIPARRKTVSLSGQRD